MRVLLIGSGGREHALAWKISKSRLLTKLFIAPGNAGTAECGTNVNLPLSNFHEIAKFCLDQKIDMLVVGPEDPLVRGIHDFFKESPEYRHIKVIGPTKEAAKLEGSKQFAKEFMLKNGIPTARFFSVTSKNLDEGIKFLRSLKPPYVLKADGLAAGKGVLIMSDLDEAGSELKQMLDGKFGEASKTVVIEEYLSGIELSAFVITDGESYILLPEAKDYKRIGEGDTGLNTGGMGAVSPVPFAGQAFISKIEEKIILPTLKGLNNENIRYTGFIFFGLINVDGEPYVIEYNVRMGDPEAEVVIPRFKNDLLEVFLALDEQKLGEVKPVTEEKYAVTVMLVSGGYPEAYDKGKVIENIGKTKGSLIFHAGTKIREGQILTNGGRVIAVSSFGDNMAQALEKSYKNAEIISFEKKYFRKDIGFDLI